MFLPPLLPFLVWSSAAFAAGLASPEREVATPADVEAWVSQVTASVGGPVLVGAAGADAERLAIKIAQSQPVGQLRVLRVGSIGDAAAEMDRALGIMSLPCGIRLGTTSGGTFTVAAYGACGSKLPSAGPRAPVTAPTAPVTAPTAPVAPPAPVAAPTAQMERLGGQLTVPESAMNAAAPEPSAVSSIPGLQAAIPGYGPAPVPTTGSPASVTTAPAPLTAAAPPPPDPAVIESTYKLAALKRVPNPVPPDDLPDATWAVRDGRGRNLRALEFAKRTGDSTTETQIRRQGKGSRALGWGLAVGGGALTVAALALLVARDAGAPSWGDYEPNITDYRTNEAYYEALADAEADYRAAEDAHEILKDDRLWIAGFVGGAGVISMVGAPIAAQGVAEREAQPALYWDEKEADALIATHNAELRKRLSLAPETAPAAAVPPSSAKDDEDDGPDDLDAEPEDDAPRENPPLPKDGPPGNFHLILGPGWAGLSGTF